MKFIIPFLLAVLISGTCQADPPDLRDRQTGKYLGNLSANPYDPNSVIIRMVSMEANTARTLSITPMGNMAVVTAMTASTIPMLRIRRQYMTITDMTPVTVTQGH